MTTVEEALQTLRDAIQAEIEEEQGEADTDFFEEIAEIGVNLNLIGEEDRDDDTVAALELYQDDEHDLQVLLNLDQVRGLHAALGAIIRKERTS